MEDRPPELAMALLPSLVRTMLMAFVEAVAQHATAGSNDINAGQGA